MLTPMEDEPPVKGPLTPILIGSAAKLSPDQLMSAEVSATLDVNLAKRVVMLSPICFKKTRNRTLAGSACSVRSIAQNETVRNFNRMKQSIARQPEQNQQIFCVPCVESATLSNHLLQTYDVFQYSVKLPYREPVASLLNDKK